MAHLYNRIQEAKQFLEKQFTTPPHTAIIAGTGMGELAARMEDKIEIFYRDIPHFPETSVESHKGSLLYGYISGCPVLFFSGRFHYYEGYDPTEVTFPVRVASALGAAHLIMTNAAGGVNPHYSEGDLVLLSDHINLMPGHPLRGFNDQRLGLRFPDMLQAYDSEKRTTFQELARKMNISLKSGVYLALQGPSLETPAEYKMIRLLGADLVGMSTVPEVIVARHEQMKVTVFSIVSNVCYPPDRLKETTIESVIRVVNQSSETLSALLYQYFSTLK